MRELSFLDCNILQSLYRKYWPDFRLFGYSMQEYIPWANRGRGCPDWTED
jgi:hypothetical protein